MSENETPNATDENLSSENTGEQNDSVSEVSAEQAQASEEEHVYVKTFRRKFIDPVMNTLLTVAAVFGVISLIFWIAAVSMGYSIVLFLTGSMEPSIPTGSASITQEIDDPQQVSEGDVLTVSRHGEPLPITHRVVSVNEDESVSEAIEEGYEYTLEDEDESLLYSLTAGRFGEDNTVANTHPLTEEAVQAGDVSVITMRGDANDVDDPRYYMITDSNAREYIAHAPYVGYAIGAVRDNVWFFLTGVTVLIAYSIYPWESYKKKKKSSLSDKEREKLNSDSKDVLAS